MARRKKKTQPIERIGLKLTPAERKLLLDEDLRPPRSVAQAILATPSSQPVMLSIDDLEELANWVAAAHSDGDDALRKRLDRLYGKIEGPLHGTSDAPGPDPVEASSTNLLEFPLNSLIGERSMIQPLPQKSKKGEVLFPLELTKTQREALIHATRLRGGLKNRLQELPEGTQVVGFTRKEIEEAAEEVDTSLHFAPSPYKKRLEAVFDRLEDLIDALEEDRPEEPSTQGIKKTHRIYQLKVTLKDIKPPIWRRILVPDGTLGELHQVIQIAMGWTDSHLHQFIIRGDIYAPDMPDDLGFGMDMDVTDEDTVRLSQVITGDRKVKFRYEYDFGDGWQHEIQFERIVEREPKVKYPRCIDGARACPPEDVGGPWGYPNFLAAIADPKHEQHEELLEWLGDGFDPEEFSVEEVNAALRQLT